MSTVTSFSNHQKTELKKPLSPLVEIIYLPGWWYTVGLSWLVKRLLVFLKNKSKSLNIGVWIRYLFVPMFGEKDTVSRFISFGVRFFQIIFRTWALISFCLLVIATIFIWLFLPVMMLWLFWLLTKQII